MPRTKVVALITSMGWLGVGSAARAESISGAIDTEWFFPPVIYIPVSLPAVESIDSIVIELASTYGGGLALYMDASAVPGELDFNLMFQDSGDLGPDYSTGTAVENGTLANVAPYEFVPPGGGGSDVFTVPHAAPGTYNANAWVSGPLAAQDYVLVVGDTSFFEPGAAGSWTINYTPEAGSPADINGDGVVNVDDLLAVIGGWGDCPPPPKPCATDVNADGTVNVDDLLQVITKWG